MGFSHQRSSLLHFFSAALAIFFAQSIAFACKIDKLHLSLHLDIQYHIPNSPYSMIWDSKS